MSLSKRAAEQAESTVESKQRKIVFLTKIPSLSTLCACVWYRLPPRLLLNKLQQLPLHLFDMILKNLSALQMIVLMDMLKAGQSTNIENGHSYIADEKDKPASYTSEQGRKLVQNVERIWLIMRQYSCEILPSLQLATETVLPNEKVMGHIYEILYFLNRDAISSDIQIATGDSSQNQSKIRAFWSQWNRWDAVPPQNAFRAKDTVLGNATTSPILHLLRCIFSKMSSVQLHGFGNFTWTMEMLRWMVNIEKINLSNMHSSRPEFIQLQEVYKLAQEYGVQELCWSCCDIVVDDFAASASPDSSLTPIDLTFVNCRFSQRRAQISAQKYCWRVGLINFQDIILDIDSVKNAHKTASKLNPFQQLVNAIYISDLKKLVLDSVLINGFYRPLLQQSLQCKLSELELINVTIDTDDPVNWIRQCFQHSCKLQSLSVQYFTEPNDTIGVPGCLTELLMSGKMLSTLCIAGYSSDATNAANILTLVRQLPLLSSFTFIYQYLGDADAIPALLELLEHPRLQELNINFTTQRNTDIIVALFANLFCIKSLKTLKISNSRIDDTLIDTLVHALEKHRLPLNCIDLTHNHITNVGVTRLATALHKQQQSATFKILLDHNHASPQFINSFRLSQLYAHSWHKPLYRNILDGFDEM
ncbi:hypothetical protein BDF19DRAFT_433760 [Syncephalis fuscata]|nr:hypothetical protein BDF19DRAFT_433760 [Syncephalis fuscata]